MRRRVLIALVVLVAVVVVVRLAAPSGGSGSGPGGQPGQLAPLFDSTDVNGKRIQLADYRGHRVVLNFWASWCVPCRAEFPVLRRLVASHPDVVVLGVVFDDSDGPARAFLEAQRATWPGVRDPRSQIADAYDVHAKPGIPVSVLIDSTGRVKDRHFGPLADDGAALAFASQAN